MKYNLNSKYRFECEIVTTGLKAKSIEDKIKILLTDFIKEINPELILFSNECVDEDDRKIKLLSVIEEISILKYGKIIHIGKIPTRWTDSLKKEMNEKNELNKKRLSRLDDCVMLCVENENKIYALIIDRQGIYSLSSNAP